MTDAEKSVPYVVRVDFAKGIRTRLDESDSHCAV